LAVLLIAPFFETIHVHDVFAGAGVSKNQEKGSALISAEVVQETLKNSNPKNKQIALSLNDADAVNYQELLKHLKPFQFAAISNLNAGTYLEQWTPIPMRSRRMTSLPAGRIFWHIQYVCR